MSFLQNHSVLSVGTIHRLGAADTGRLLNFPPPIKLHNLLPVCPRTLFPSALPHLPSAHSVEFPAKRKEQLGEIFVSLLSFKVSTAEGHTSTRSRCAETKCSLPHDYSWFYLWVGKLIPPQLCKRG